MRLIVTEKDNSAKKIAQILSQGKAKPNKVYAIPYYTWGEGDDAYLVIGLKGHLMNPAFPEGFSEWRKVEPRELIDASLIKEPVQKAVHKALRKVAKDASSVVIATDYDREGELIGLEALEEILDVNPKLAADREGVSTVEVPRARYSALTKEEIEPAFANPDTLSEALARAGEARQDIDLIWGATLTRFVSLATGRLGSQFLSVGRVQSPTLAIVVDRELERRAHVPEPYWEVFARFEHPDGAFVAHHKEDRFWKEEEAKAALEGTKAPGVVKSVAARKSTRQPPTPFNTTAFTSAASSIGVTPARAMRIAEDLYMDGFISYPRTDNTVYPNSLPLRELLQSIASIDTFKEAAPIAAKDKLEPTRGKKETKDHPPIYPTQALDPSVLPDSQHQKIYELVVRRFVATFADPAVSESTRADIEAGSETYFVRGSVLVEPGFLSVYHYSRSKDEEIPKLEEGQQLQLASPETIALPHGADEEEAVPRTNPWADGKETQPPPRIGQGKLIELMEERGLGTKATRHDIIQKLYNRGYIQSNPIEPSETGIAMVKAFERFAERIATPDMTAELEADMDKIADGKVTKDEVVKLSREMLHEAYNSMDQNKEELAKTIWEGMDQDRILGPCWKCKEEGRAKDDGSPNRLRIIRARKSGKRFVGCEGYPDCDQTYGIPQRGDLIRLEEVCSICGKTPRLKVLSGRRPWNLCLNEECPSMEEMRAARAEREAAKAAKEAAAEVEAAEAAADGEVKVSKPKRKAPSKTKASAKS
jgi:DNA topoisomerase-1